MCSINGCTGADPDLVSRMNAITRHRGPDDTGVWHDGANTLGNNRLAIIDVSPAGHQPMVSADERYVIAFNGEIYNFRQLRAELSPYPFKSQSDTEVILAGFAAWGTDVFAKLGGIFGLAIADRKTGTLYLARDRSGVKPLYLHRGRERVLFSSEMKAILEDASVKRQLNRAVLERYLRVGYTPGQATLIDGIEKLPAGSFATVRGTEVSIRSYVRQERGETLRGKAAQEAVREAIDAAVAAQLVSDRPLGVYLSGGIDSSVVLDCMSRVRSNIDTFSVGFRVPDPAEEKKFNADFEIARSTAAHYGTRHHELLLGADDLQSLFEDAIYHLDEPVGNATALPQLALSRFAKEFVTVVLCGDGGDELFGGYGRYKDSLRLDRYQSLMPKTLTRIGARAYPRLSRFLVPKGAPRYAAFHFIKDRILKEVAPHLTTDALHNDAAEALGRYESLSFGDAFMRLDRQWWLVDEALLRTDKMTMAAGVEARVPLLDERVVAVADRIALSEKVSINDTKKILKAAFASRLPPQVLSQPKRGWFSPGAKWLRDPSFERYAREVLSQDYTKATKDLFDWRGVERVLDDHVAGRRYNLHLLWSLLALQAWAHRFGVTA